MKSGAFQINKRYGTPKIMLLIQCYVNVVPIISTFIYLSFSHQRNFLENLGEKQLLYGHIATGVFPTYV